MNSPDTVLSKEQHEIMDLRQEIQRQDDIIHQHTQNLTLLNEGLAMALAQLREMKANG